MGAQKNFLRTPSHSLHIRAPDRLLLSTAISGSCREIIMTNEGITGDRGTAFVWLCASYCGIVLILILAYGMLPHQSQF
eukprot:5425605-Amphidinium_carterae.2